jgi:cellobiose phosphorylase
MEAVDRNLVKEDKGIILLLTPPFEKSKLEPGYIKGYVAGVRENGGQYTHAAVWVILALTKLGFGDKALQYYNMINPINHSNTELECNSYKVEPYVMAADVYIREPHGGRGGWSWYTGASGWMYKVGLEDILGLKKIEGKGYKIEPCIPKDWDEYTIKINNETEEYEIKVVRGDEEKIIINGEEISSKLIPRNKGKLEITAVIL